MDKMISSSNLASKMSSHESNSQQISRGHWSMLKWSICDSNIIPHSSGCRRFKPQLRPVYEPQLRPVYEPQLRPVYEPQLRPVYEPQLRPVYEPQLRPVYEPQLRPVYEPQFRPVYEPQFRPVYEVQPTRGKTCLLPMFSFGFIFILSTTPELPLNLRQ